MQLGDVWYILALSEQLKPNKVLPRKFLGEWLAHISRPRWRICSFARSLFL
ncbi:hypothetical protein [Anabaena sp. CCY 0017]|uniref:hypothetical protein n=1 Tax=Anabaena sp. CCY 0017 TaxID=3103866 RepID=UPI0039C6A66C